jgi:hypothetical protein
MRVLYVVVETVSLGLWTLIGLVFYIPILARSIAYLVGAILYCAVADADPGRARMSFDNAVTFYSRGFMIIHQVFRFAAGCPCGGTA